MPLPTALLKLRSDEQLVSLFRAGNDEAFRVIHDRYRARLFAYTRQMLPASRQDAEDALQDVFVRAYRALRTSDRELALRPWLYRVAHNRCIDEMRRPPAPAPELLETVRSPDADPLAAAERRDDLRRLVTDLGRLPEQQRSALLMREIDGLPYAHIAAALQTSVPAVKSLLVRARMSLAQSGEARDTACVEIRGQLSLARDRGVRASGQARRHLRDCEPCRTYRSELRTVERRLAAFVPSLGPAALAAKLLGFGGAGAGGASGVCSTGAAAGGAVCGSGAATGAVVAAAAASKVVAVVAVAAVAAGGAVNVEHRLTPPVHHPAVAGVAPATTTAPAVTPAAHSSAIPVHSLVAAVHRAAAHRAAPPVAHKSVATRHWTRQPSDPLPVAVENPAAAAPATGDPDATTTDPGGTATTDPTTPTTDPAASTPSDPAASPTVPTTPGTQTTTAPTAAVSSVAAPVASTTPTGTVTGTTATSSATTTAPGSSR